MSVPAGTPLQRATRAHAELVRSWRDTLSADEYRAFTRGALTFLVREGDRLALGEILHVLRAEAGE